MGYLDLAKDDVDAELACTVDDALLGFIVSGIVPVTAVVAC